MNKIFIFLVISSFLTISIQAQDKEKVGISQQLFSQQGGLYNFSEEGKVNIVVNALGFIKLPGKYIIPKGSTLVDLLSYAGGPLTEANLQDIRLFRPKNDTLKVTKDELIKINYNDIFWEEEVNYKSNRNIELLPGDVLVFPGGPRYFFRDNLSLMLSALSTVVAITVLIVTIYK